MGSEVLLSSSSEESSIKTTGWFSAAMSRPLAPVAPSRTTLWSISWVCPAAPHCLLWGLSCHPSNHLNQAKGGKAAHPLPAAISHPSAEQKEQQGSLQSSGLFLGGRGRLQRQAGILSREGWARLGEEGTMGRDNGLWEPCILPSSSAWNCESEWKSWTLLSPWWSPCPHLPSVSAQCSFHTKPCKGISHCFDHISSLLTVLGAP